MNILTAKAGDQIKVWLKDIGEPEGGIWVTNTVKEHNGELCLWENDWNYTDLKNDPPLPLTFFTNDPIEILEPQTTN